MISRLLIFLSTAAGFAMAGGMFVAPAAGAATIAPPPSGHCLIYGKVILPSSAGQPTGHATCTEQVGVTGNGRLVERFKGGGLTTTVLLVKPFIHGNATSQTITFVKNRHPRIRCTVSPGDVQLGWVSGGTHTSCAFSQRQWYPTTLGFTDTFKAPSSLGGYRTALALGSVAHPTTFRPINMVS